MAARKACVIDETEQIDPPEKEPTPEEEEQAMWEWFFDVAFPHLAPHDPFVDGPYRSTPGLEEDFEALCDAALESQN